MLALRLKPGGPWAMLCAVVLLVLSAVTAEGAPRGEVDPTTLSRKLIMGYQGWHFVEGDGSGVGWWHWTHRQRMTQPNLPPNGDRVAVDLWPDMSELDADELYETELTDGVSGRPASVYSSFHRKTVLRHFKWMEEYEIDGVMLQRFSRELSGLIFHARNQVIRHVRDGAEAHGRVFALMYDISESDWTTLNDVIRRDWKFLVDELRITDSPRYLHHKGLPVVGLWGIGYAFNEITPAQALELIGWFQDPPEERYRATLLGGIPGNWTARDGTPWMEVFLSFDVVSPWTVRHANGKETMAGYAYLARHAPEAKFLPVVWPGFSWSNFRSRFDRWWLGTRDVPNAVPRYGGHFFWDQVFRAIRDGATMIYVAMFDEVDEGTAMYKLAPTYRDVPKEAPFVALDADGYTLPSDWYLQLAREAGRMLRGDIALEAPMPIKAGESQRLAWAAEVVSYDLPQRIPVAGSMPGSVTLRNTGRTTWVANEAGDVPMVGLTLDGSEGAFAFFLPEGARAGFQLADMRDGMTVSPGERLSVPFILAAPRDAGTFWVKLTPARQEAGGVWPLDDAEYVMRKIVVEVVPTPESQAQVLRWGLAVTASISQQ